VDIATRRERGRWRLIAQLDEWLQVPMLLLSLVWLALVVIELSSGESRLLETIGIVIWALFLLEFAVRLALAPDKSVFFKRNWLTVIALAIPALRVLRALAFLRAARALRSIRLVRIVGTANRSMNALRDALKRRQAGYVAALTLAVVLLGAAGMLSFEPAGEVENGFISYADALWWTVMLISSIGSAYWPVTVEGRLLTALLALYGLGVIGYIAATFASFFVGRDAEARGGPVAGSADLDALRRELRAIRQAIDRANDGPAQA
jgi:voltage-gated potassium channel